MTGHATAEADDEDFTNGAILLLMLFLNVVVDVCGAAFVYKVWNERQQTHVYEREAAALEGIRDEIRAHGHDPRKIREQPLTYHLDSSWACNGQKDGSTFCGQP